MGFDRRASQSRWMRFTTQFPTIPDDLPDDVRKALADWRDDLVGSIKDDHQTIEDAFARLRAELQSSDSSAAVAALEARITALENGTSKWPLIYDINVAPQAAIQESKLALKYPTHSNANDPTTDEKKALAGSNGAPGPDNKYVTESDPRLEPASIKPPQEMTFATPASTWTWAHNLGYRPLVETYDLNRKKIIADVDNSDPNTLVVNHLYNATGIVTVAPWRS